MADSDFWCDLAAQFLSLHDDGPLSSDWQEAEDPAVLGEWTLGGPLIIQAQFDALARRGAMSLPYQGTPDLLKAWLEALRLNGDGFKIVGSYTSNETGVQVETLLGRFSQLSLISANYCKKLESEALQVEFEDKRRDELQKPLSPPLAQPGAETVAAQLSRLRAECHLTIEELAEKVEMDVRSVERHLAAKTVPYDRHLRVYERAFSKLLNRQVFISKMP